MCAPESTKSPETRRGPHGRGGQGSTITAGKEHLRKYRGESKENEDLINCVDSNLVQGSGVVSIASGGRGLAEEPEYSDARLSNGNEATIKSTLSGDAMQATYGSLRSGQAKARKEENDTVSTTSFIT